MTFRGSHYVKFLTGDQIDCLIQTAAEAVHGNAIADGNLSGRQINLSKLVYSWMMVESETQEEILDVNHDDLKVEAMRLAAEIEHLTQAWDATAEVDTNLGDEVQRTGQALVRLADTLAASFTEAYPARAAKLYHFSAELSEAVNYYSDLEEHEIDASIDIFDRLGPGVALILRAIHIQRESAADERVTARDLITQLQWFPSHHEVWVSIPSAAEGFVPIVGQAHRGEDPDASPGDPTLFIVLSPDG